MACRFPSHFCELGSASLGMVLLFHISTTVMYMLQDNVCKNSTLTKWCLHGNVGAAVATSF